MSNDRRVQGDQEKMVQEPKKRSDETILGDSRVLDHPEKPDVVRFAAWLLVAALFIAGLYVGQGVLIPLAIAFLISFALSPLVGWLVRIGLPRVLSVIAVMLMLGMFLGGLGTLVTTQVQSLSEQLPTYQTTIRSKISDLTSELKGPGMFDGALETVDTVKEEVTDAVDEEEPGAEPPPERVEVVPPKSAPIEEALSWLAPVITPLATAGIVLVFVFLALLDRGDLRDRMLQLFGDNLHRSTDALQEASSRISKYLLMQLVVNFSYGIPLALGLWVIGVPGWILWGTLGALMRFIPYVGPILAAFFPLTLAFAVDPGWEMIIWAVALIVFLELVSNNIIEPLLYGTSTGLSAMSLIAAATFWTALWGPVGLILSTPLTVCLLVIGRNIPYLSFLETLLGSTPALDVPTRVYQRLIANEPDEALGIIDDVIGEDGVTGFYNDHGIDVLRRASEDYYGNARAEHRMRIANSMDAILDDLKEEYPTQVALDSPPVVACIGGKWEIDVVACEMLVHALGLKNIPAIEHPAGTVSSRYIDRLGLEGVDIVCLSYFSRDADASIKTLCRRLRQRWPHLKIVLALWNAIDEQLEDDRIAAISANEAVTSINEAVERIRFLLRPEEAAATRLAEAPENDAARVRTLEATGVLDGRDREEFDALSVRAADVFGVEMAMISAIDAEREVIIGQNMDLPGELTRDGTNRITMPRNEAICDHVVASGETLTIEDTEREPRFADHPAVRLWDARFYAGAPLMTGDGEVLGALCLLDGAPRKLEKEELDLLGSFAADVVSVITGEKALTPKSRGDDEEASSSIGQRVPD